MQGSNRDYTISVRVPAEWAEELARRAEAGDRRRSDEVRRAIRAYLAINSVEAERKGTEEVAA